MANRMVNVQRRQGKASQWLVSKKETVGFSEAEKGREKNAGTRGFEGF